VVACLSILVAASFSTLGQAPAGNVPHSPPMELAARDELNQGVKAYKSARYEEAIAHFQKATELAPGLPMAKKYLATALAQNVVPGLDTPENMKVARQAIDIFQQVLEKDPHDVNSLKQVAGIYFSVKKLEDAKEWQKKVLDEDPNDPEAAYTIGVIDWTEAHINLLKAFLPIGISDDGMGNAKAPAAVMEDLKAQNGALVEEALEYLNQAVENRPDYDDAMAYLNLVYRRKADGDWGNAAARKDDLAKAEEWRTKAMNTRKANEEKKIAGPESAQP
jgi:tetratricopeptide (TPR) repeat protein